MNCSNNKCGRLIKEGDESVNLIWGEGSFYTIITHLCKECFNKMIPATAENPDTMWIQVRVELEKRKCITDQ